VSEDVYKWTEKKLRRRYSELLAKYDDLKSRNNSMATELEEVYGELDFARRRPERRTVMVIYRGGPIDGWQREMQEPLPQEQDIERDGLRCWYDLKYVYRAREVPHD
jgi:hypothetical protein